MEQQQQQGGTQGRRAAKGEGYTVRVDGRKVLMTKVLEERAADLQRQCEGLQAENDALRAKEAEQMKCLEFYEVWVKRIAAANDAPPDCPQDSNDSSSMPRPARLERQAKQLLRNLKQQPEPQLESHDSCQAASRSTATTATTATHDTAPHNSSSSSAVGATSSGSRGSSARQPEEKMARWHSCITPEDLSYFSNVSAEDLAVRLCDIIARLEVAHRHGGGPQQQGGGGGSESAFEVLEDMGRLCAVQVVGNEKALAKVMGMNLETQQVEPPPPGLWQRVAETADLQPQQKVTVIEAYRSFTEAVVKLKEQQHSLMEQLQVVLGVGLSHRATAGSAAAAASAGVTADAAPAGPSHFMSLATGEPVAGVSAQDEAAAAEQEAAADYSTPRAVTDSPMHLETASSPIPDAFVAFLRDYLHDCKDRAAASTSTSSLSSSAATGSSSSSSWLAPAGVLALQDAERAEELLHRLARISPSIQQQVHQLTIMFVNLLTTEQRAEVVLTAYPYMVTATDFCAAVAQGEAQEQQQQATPTTRRGRAQRSTARRGQAGKNPRMS